MKIGDVKNSLAALFERYVKRPGEESKQSPINPSRPKVEDLKNDKFSDVLKQQAAEAVRETRENSRALERRALESNVQEPAQEPEQKPPVQDQFHPSSESNTDDVNARNEARQTPQTGQERKDSRPAQHAEPAENRSRQSDPIRKENNRPQFNSDKDGSKNIRQENDEATQTRRSTPEPKTTKTTESRENPKLRSYATQSRLTEEKTPHKIDTTVADEARPSDTQQLEPAKNTTSEKPKTARRGEAPENQATRTDHEDNTGPSKKAQKPQVSEPSLTRETHSYENEKPNLKKADKARSAQPHHASDSNRSNPREADTNDEPTTTAPPKEKANPPAEKTPPSTTAQSRNTRAVPQPRNNTDPATPSKMTSAANDMQSREPEPQPERTAPLEERPRRSTEMKEEKNAPPPIVRANPFLSTKQERVRSTNTEETDTPDKNPRQSLKEMATADVLKLHGSLLDPSDPTETTPTQKHLKKPFQP